MVKRTDWLNVPVIIIWLLEDKKAYMEMKGKRGEQETHNMTEPQKYK